MTDILKSLLQNALNNSQFPPTSRYAGVETATKEIPDGRSVVHLKRRFLPAARTLAVLQEHTVKEGERLDHIATTHLGDPEQFWRLCDANDAMEPSELTSEPGRTLKVALPEGMTGLRDA